MSEQTFHLVEAIRDRLRAAVRRITLAELAFGLVLTLGVAAAVWLVAAAVEAGFWLDVTPRSALFFTILALTGGLAVYFLVLPLLRLAGLLRGPSDEVVAQRIGTRYPEVSDRLVNLLHLAEGRNTEAPAPMIDHAVRSLGEQVRGVPFEQVEDFRRARRAGRLASLPLVGLLVFLLAAPTAFLGASHRLLSPGTYFDQPAPFRFLVEPGEVELVKGDPLDIIIHADGQDLPRQITLFLNNLDEEHVEEVRLKADSTGAFRHRVDNVRRSLRYRAGAYPVDSRWYEATVTERPVVRDLQVALAFPSYTGLPPQRLDPNVGDVTALPGTRIALDVGVGGRDVDAAFVRFDDGRLDTLALDGEAAKGSFSLRREGTYQVVLRNEKGVENSDPITYSLKLLADAYPAIVLLKPQPDLILDDAMRVGTRSRISDDFGFSRLRLYYRLAETRFGQPMTDFEALDLPLNAPRQLDQEIFFDWPVSAGTGLDPVPGDVIEYFFQVWDNDRVAGFKSARSNVHRLRLPSLAEQYEDLDQEQTEAEEKMEGMLEETQEIREVFEELRDELRRKQDADWEDKRQLEQLQERQERLEENVESLSEQMEDITEQMQQNDLVSDETLQMYEELKKVVEEINSPELQEALKQLQEAMEQLNLQQMQESLQNFEFNEEQYQQRLERTLELFKKLRVQQKLDEAAKRAEELARQQEKLAKETKKLQDKQEEKTEGEGEREKGGEGEKKDGEKGEGEKDEQSDQNKQGDKNEQGDEKQQGDKGEKNNEQPTTDNEPTPEQLAKQQEMSSEEMKQLEKLLEELKEQMDALKNGPKQEMKQLQQDVQQQQLPQQMQENAEQLRKEETQKAQQQQQQMQQQLQQMQQQLSQMQQGMQGQQQQMNLSGLRRSLEDILTLSQQQENLRGGVDALTSDSPQLRDFAQTQVELAEGLSTVSDSLQRLARDIPQMSREVQKQAGDALKEMGNATEAMADRRAREATGHQKESMMHLNELALLLSDLLNQMMNASGSGSGSMSMQQMMQQLQQMAGEQQKLNQQIQQMLNDMQGQRLSQDAQERLRQMAGQQDALRRQLKDLSRNREMRGKALGDLEKIAEQMEETIQELQRNNVDRRTVERQRQILTRLLDAQRSLRERGQEKKREGTQGKDQLNRERPGELTPSEQADKLRRDLIRALESGYAPDYQELIKRYFDLLQQQSQE